MATPQKNEEMIMSSHDMRQSYNEVWKDYADEIMTAVSEGDYKRAFDSEMTMINFLPHRMKSTFLNWKLVWRFFELYKKWQENNNFDLEAFRINAEQAEMELKVFLWRVQQEITDCMSDHNLLLPLHEVKQLVSPHDIARAYEAAKTGFVENTEKRIKSYEEFAAGYGYVDITLRLVLGVQRWLNERREDDGFFFFAGRNNTGKSTLVHHVHTLWTEGRPNPDHCAWDKETYSKVLFQALSEPAVKDRVAHWDEANLSSRAAMTSFNREIMDNFWSNRSQRGLHLWCNPSIEILDKPLVKERLSGLFLVHLGQDGRRGFAMRRYSFFTAKSLMELWAKEGSISLQVLEENADRYALWSGWFLRFADGDFLMKYQERKEQRNLEKSRLLAENHAGTLSAKEAGKMFGMNPEVVKRHAKKLFAKGVLKEYEIISPSGRWFFKQKHLDAIRASVAEARDRQRKVLNTGKEGGES